MIKDIYHYVYLITNSFNIVIILTLMNSFYVRRITNKVVCSLSYLLHFFATSIIYLCFDIPFLTLAVNFVILFVISLNYESEYKNKVFVSLHILLLLMIPELVIGVFTGFIHFSFFSEAGYRNNIGAVSVRIITYMEALLIKNYRTVKNNNKVSNSEWVASIFIPITTLILEIMIIQSEHLSSAAVIFSLILVLILNFTAFYLYDSLAESYRKIADFAVMKKENELYSKQCELMQNSTESLQAFRHDLNNQFVVLSELMENHEYDLAKKQISDLFAQTKSNIVYSATGNIVIDGLINYKLQKASEENIIIDSEIAVPDNMEIGITDIITIIGNILDNAVCAVLKLPEQQRKIYIKIVYDKDRLIIHSENPYNSEIKYMNGEIITSKNDSKNHGYGLKNTEKTVEKYDGYMEINHSESIFKIDVLLYLTAFRNSQIPEHCK